MSFHRGGGILPKQFLNASKRISKGKSLRLVIVEERMWQTSQSVFFMS